MTILSALSERSDNSVDWWFAYKLPEDVSINGSAKTTGLEYLYLDSGCNKALALTGRQIDSPESALMRTLDQLNEKNRSTQKSLGWILYNDEKPDRTEDSETKGHSKGALVFDQKTDSAFWLLHSWPCFPSLHQAPFPSAEYGQTFLCVSLRDFKTAEEIAKQMYQQNEPQVYDFRTDGLPEKSWLYRLARNTKSNDQDPPADLRFQSRGGYDFRFLAKNRHWDEDFWIDWVRPRLDVNLDVETWRRGKRPGTEDCDGDHCVEDTLYVNLEQLGVNCEWHYTKDHSKWAVSESGAGHWVCVADINRQISQEKRGGGVICFQHEQFWKDLSNVAQLKS
jgi:deoxyribonuclease-2